MLEEKPQLVDPPYSFFDLAKEYGGLKIKPLKRALSILRRHGVRTMLRSHDECGESSFLMDEDEPEVFEKVVNSKGVVNSKVTKIKVDTLTFFDQPYTDKCEIPKDGRSLLGQITLKGYVSEKATSWKVKECLIIPNKADDYYICAFKRHEITQPISAIIEAACHCQQTEVTNCCAHAAIRVALECLPSESVKRLPTHREINKILGIDHVKRKLWKGVYAWEIADILLKIDRVRPIVYEFKKGTHSPQETSNKKRLSFEHLAYLGIESAYPVILGFKSSESKSEEGDGHVVTAVGHTFNGDNWLPEAVVDYSLTISESTKLGYIPSAAWMDNLILQDDNYGPYYCLPVSFLNNANLHNMDLTLVVVSDLDKNECFADHAEVLAIGALKSLIESVLKQKKTHPGLPHE